MKLTIRFRDVAPTPALLDHVKASIASAIRPHPWRVVRLRATLAGEPSSYELAPDEWFRCRIEATLQSGSVRVIEAASSDALVAIDMAADRLANVSDVALRPRSRRWSDAA